MTSAVPPGLGSLYIASQALRAWLRSACSSGTKASRPSKGVREKAALSRALGLGRGHYLIVLTIKDT
jgi:hypothetical protein